MAIAEHYATLRMKIIQAVSEATEKASDKAK
jgi:hypothetical protein